jgi:phosphoglycolate phosphatase
MQLTERPKFDGVFFDLDGTLLDTADDLGATLNALLAQHQLPMVSREKYREVASDGANALLTLGFGDYLASIDISLLREKFLSWYEQHIATYTRYYPTIENIIKLLNQHQIPWGIITNKPQLLTMRLLEHFPLLASCKIVIGGDFLPERKPHPLPLLTACEHAHTAPQHCLYLGDHRRDIEAAQAAKMISAVAGWGYIKANDNPTQWQANHYFETTTAFYDFLISNIKTK